MTTAFNQPISRREWTRVLIYGVLLLLILSLPYWVAWAKTDGEHVFSGFLFGANDANSYVAKMRLGVQGHWKFYIFYTAEEHEGVWLIYVFYMIAGQIIGLFANQNDPALAGIMIGVYHLLRWIFGALLIGVLYRFIAVFVADARARFIALVLATIGGGFGWVLLFTGANSPPPEFYIPEGFTLQVLLSIPHLALARAALLGGFLLLFASLNREYWLRYALLAALCWGIMGAVISFYLVTVYCVLAGWGLAMWIRERRFPQKLLIRGGIAAGLTLPLVLYSFVIFSADPIFSQWAAQNTLFSPPPHHYLLAYLPLGVLAIIGGRAIWREVDRRWLLLIVWPLLVPILVYLPLSVQRRLAEGVIVPLAILAALGIEQLARRWSFRRVLVGTLLATLPASLVLLSGGFLTALAGSPQVVYPVAEIAAFDWLNQHAEPESVVLSVFTTGTIIPVYANLRVYVGHGPETLNSPYKTQVAQQFFADELTAEERAVLYNDSRIRYIFYGPAERQNAPDSPSWLAEADRIYAEGPYEIFRLP